MNIFTIGATGNELMGNQPTQDRKYKAFWGVFCFISVALAWNWLTGEQFVEALIFVFGLFMGGNALEHGADAVKSHQKGIAAKPKPMEVSVTELQTEEERRK